MYKSSSAKSWRKYHNRYQIIGVKCKECSKKFYPPVQICSNCGSTSLTKYSFEDGATLVSWSEVHAAPIGFEYQVPYIVGIVELEAGEKMTTQIVDIKLEELHHGLKLRPVFKKIYPDGDSGIIHYGVMFTAA